MPDGYDARTRWADLQTLLEALKDNPQAEMLLQRVRSRVAQALNAGPPPGEVLGMLFILGGGEGLLFAPTDAALQEAFGAGYRAVTRGREENDLGRLLRLEGAALEGFLGEMRRKLTYIFEQAIIGAKRAGATPDPERVGMAHAALRDELNAMPVRDVTITVHVRSDAGPFVRPETLKAMSELLGPDWRKALVDRLLLRALLAMEIDVFRAEASRLAKAWLEMWARAEREAGSHSFGDQNDQH